jgi:thiosulfate dehydrogenase (quinone) large subunit
MFRKEGQMSEKTCCCCVDPRSLAPALIRWAMGVMFLIAGVTKLLKLGGFVKGYLVPAFAATFLPGALVAAYGYALPFVETVLGVLLITGLCRTTALLVTGVTLISLAFGQILLQQTATVANIFMYILMVAAALYMSDRDCWCIPCSKGGKVREE